MKKLSSKSGILEPKQRSVEVKPDKCRVLSLPEILREHRLISGTRSTSTDSTVKAQYINYVYVACWWKSGMLYSLRTMSAIDEVDLDLTRLPSQTTYGKWTKKPWHWLIEINFIIYL